MKREIFWKLIVILFLIWLFLWLWNNSIYIERVEGGATLKFNKLTGKVWRLTKDGWIEWRKYWEE